MLFNIKSIIKMIWVGPNLYFGPPPGSPSYSAPEEENERLTKLNDIQTQYGYGDCSYLAIAMNKAYGYPMVNFNNEDGETFHTAVAVDDFVFMDAFGVCTQESICGRYGEDPEFCEIIGTDLKDAAMLYPFTESDIEDATEALEFLAAQHIVPGPNPTVETNKVTDGADTYTDSADSVFTFEPIDSEYISLNETFEKDDLYGSDLFMVVGDKDTCDKLYAQMKGWITLPMTIEEALDTENECCIVRTKINDSDAVLAFDLGGSDNCTYQLMDKAKKENVDCLSKVHAYPEDVIDFVASLPKLPDLIRGYTP